MGDDRTQVEDAPRSATGREWEVFVREDTEGPLKHVGSVTAATADTAHEHASSLFDWAARDVWLCPADETRRYTTHTLGDARSGEPEEGSATEPGGEST